MMALPALSVEPIPAGNLWFSCSNDGNLYALDGATGVLKWKFATGHMVQSSSPAIGADDSVYIARFRLCLSHCLCPVPASVSVSVSVGEWLMVCGCCEVRAVSVLLAASCTRWIVQRGR